MGYPLQPGSPSFQPGAGCSATRIPNSTGQAGGASHSPRSSSHSQACSRRTASRVQAGEDRGVSLSTADPVVKVPWDGTLVSVQPRIRLNRSFDQRSHVYLGYAFRVRGTVGNAEREFIVGVGEGAHAKHQFRAGDRISGEALPVADPRLETVEFYRSVICGCTETKRW